MNGRRLIALAGIAFTLTAANAVAAPQHRARLSQDLAAQLATPTRPSLDVIVDGDQAFIQALATKYGATVKKHLKHSAVLQVPTGLLDALSQDADVAHLSGDISVQGSMATTSESTGALLAAAGLGEIPGVTGRGIGIAVIDSGISKHDAIRDRIIATADFTATGSGDDRYGHGTHVAGIIAAAIRPGHTSSRGIAASPRARTS
jgi:subtilisin family serine protease